jgi:hypothetical protein
MESDDTRPLKTPGCAECNSFELRGRKDTKEGGEEGEKGGEESKEGREEAEE